MDEKTSSRVMLTCQSEYGKIKSIFIKRAADAFITDQRVDAQWRALNFLEKPDLTRAIEEYGKFENLLQGVAEEINFFEKDETVLLDSMYCRDASIATDRGMILCRMGKSARATEPEAQQKIFEKTGIPILGQIESPGTVEGGDVAWLDENTLAVGLTYRTNKEGIDQLKKLLKSANVEVITVSLPHHKGPSDVFHLMSILSPVDKNIAVVYLPLMPIDFRRHLLDRNFRLVEVPDHEFDSMGCNVLAISPGKCLMVQGNPVTRTLLEQEGCEVHAYAGKEISVKGGGGPTCLTRPLWREI